MRIISIKIYKPQPYINLFSAIKNVNKKETFNYIKAILTLYNDFIKNFKYTFASHLRRPCIKLSHKAN